MKKLVLLFSIIISLVCNYTFGQTELGEKLIRTEVKDLNKKIKTDGSLTYKSYRIYFNQNPVLKYCDSIIRTNHLNKENYILLKKYLLSPRANRKKSWVIDITKNFDIKIRDLKGDNWADKIDIEYFSDDRIKICAFFENIKIVINE